MKNIYFYKNKKKGFYCNWILDKEILSSQINFKNLKQYKYNEKYLLNKSNKNQKIFFKKLISRLKYTHNTDLKNKSWKILLNRWVKFYVDSVIFRYQFLKNVIKEDKIRNFYFSLDKKKIKIPTTLYDFNSCLNDISFNNLICYKILCYLKKKEKLNIKIFKKKNNKTKLSYLKNDLENFSNKKTIIRFFNKILGTFLSDNSPIIISSYLPKFQEIKLKFLLRSNFNWDIFFKEKNSKIINKLRKNKINRSKDLNFFKLKKKSNNDIQNLLIELFPYCFPTIYLENFNEMRCYVKNNLPIKFPKFIFTSNAFMYDEFFKFYVSDYILNKKARYFVGQHGSKYGSTKEEKNTIEEITSNKFLTWGWKNNSKHNVCGIFNTHKKKNLTNVTKLNKLILVFESLPPKRTVEDKSFKYFERFKNLIIFVKNLSTEIQDKIVFRSQAKDMNIDYFKNELLKINKNIIFDNSKDNIYPLEKSNNLAIFFYYSSGFLELISRNKLSYVFCNIKSDNYLKSFFQYFKKLKNLLIFDNSYFLAKEIKKFYYKDSLYLKKIEKNKDVLRFSNKFAKSMSSTNKIIKILI